MPKLKLNIDKPWAKDTATFLGGGVAGVVVDKLVGDALLRFAIPNPQMYSIQMHDVLLVAGELIGAHHFRKKKPMLSKLLVGMASAVVVTDTYEVVAASGRWIGLPYQPMRLAAQPLRLNITPIRPITNGRNYGAPSAGKYRAVTSSSAPMMSGIGRYRA